MVKKIDNYENYEVQFIKLKLHVLCIVYHQLLHVLSNYLFFNTEMKGQPAAPNTKNQNQDLCKLKLYEFDYSPLTTDKEIQCSLPTQSFQKSTSPEGKHNCTKVWTLKKYSLPLFEVCKWEV